MAQAYTYSDIDMMFNAHPIRQDLNKKLDEASIRQSVKNLILTNKGEFPFQPTLGSSLRSLLFENQSPAIDAAIAAVIKEVIDNYEPRVFINSISVNWDDNNNGYNITLDYMIVPFRKNTSAVLFLGR